MGMSSTRESSLLAAGIFFWVILPGCFVYAVVLWTGYFTEKICKWMVPEDL